METDSRTLYINLDRRDDRKHKTEILLKDVGLNGIRVSGVDGKLLSRSKCMAAIHPKYRHVFEAGHTLAVRKDREVASFNENVLTRGAIGCALSHRRCWRIILKNHWDYALILEDDLTWIPHDVNTRLRKVFQRLQGVDWDVVLLSYHGTQSNTRHPSSVDKVNQTWSGGLFSYLVSAQGAFKLLNTWPLIYQMDLTIAYACYAEALQCYRLSADEVISTSLLSETSFDTDVQVFKDHGQPAT